MIPNDFNEVHAEVVKLVQTFEASYDKYLKADYNETQARKDFIDKFFIALGWDVNHDLQTNPYEQEVKVERNVNVAARVKKADYAFFLKPNFAAERFFVEAKRPSAGLENADFCFQTIRYAFNSSRAAVSILTNFRDLYVIDCRYEPDIETATAQIYEKYHYTDFLDRDKFGEIYYIFGREAVAEGKLDTYAESLKPKGKGKHRRLFADNFREIDDSFLSKLEEYREVLAKMFKRKNTDLRSDDLTEAVQRTLDRLVFVRFLEDKLIEPSTILDKFGEKADPWKAFVARSKDFDKTYNGIIFKFHPIIDSPDFEVDDRIFVTICDDFASKYSPYHFNYIPIHILGSIYERFLGNVIVATAKRATIEPKPEVRKAGGVFYTPQYIVNYIVENTIGKLIENKRPADVAKMRFADIACGSGSFLLGAYDYLVRWHTGYYNQPKNEKEAKRDGCVVNEDGTFHLSFEQKKEILTNNIYGVDIDRQAYEVTQLSLFLKLLEEETVGTKQQFLTGHRESLLPSLASNIVCGNALVGSDITSGDLLEQIDEDKEKRLNPMDFDHRFRSIMQNGGFNAIIGNPPYIRIQILKETNPETVVYLNEKYQSAGGGNYDVYVVFLERALMLLNENGKVGYIVPHKFFNANYGTGLRSLLATGKNIGGVVHFGAQQVFENATTYTCILLLNASPTEQFDFVKVNNISEWRKTGASITGRIAASQLSKDEWNIVVGEGSELFERLAQMPLKLGELAEIFVGLQTSADDVFILNLVEEKESHLLLESASLGKQVEIEKEILHPIVSGTDVKAYSSLPKRQYILFPYEVVDERAAIIPLTVIANRFPQAYHYLNENKLRLQQRERGRFRDGDWHRFGRSQNLGIQNRIKICVPRLVDRLHASFDAIGSHFLDNVDVGGVTIRNDGRFSHYDLRFLLGLLNSRLFVWFFPFVSAPFRGDFRSANRQFLSQLPICHISSLISSLPNQLHDLVVRSVDQIMQFKVKLNEAKNDADRDFWTGKCERLEREIDEAVYKLYDLTPDEIKLIEGQNPEP